jgi:hypothetical protein
VHFRSRAFSLPKAGNQEHENEDAVTTDDARGVYAIADGATEGPYSRLWALALTRKFQEEPFRVGLSGDFANWLPTIDPQAQVASDTSDPVSKPWYLDRSRERGSYSSLLGLSFCPLEPGSRAPVWEAIAVGDSCLFSVSDSRITHSFPVNASYDFHDAPVLISTVPLENADLQCPAAERGVIQEHQSLVLATDALAAWLFSREQDDGAAVHALLTAKDQEGFEYLITHERETHRIKNDDCSAIVIELHF